MDLRLYSGHIWKLWLNAIPMFMDYIPVQGIQAIYKSHRFQGLEAVCVRIFRARPVIEGIQAARLYRVYLLHLLCSGNSVPGTEFREQSSGNSVPGTEFREQCSGNSVPGTVFREQSSGNI